MANVSRRPASSRKRSPGKEGHRVSLAPLSFEDALKGMLQVPPPAKQTKQTKKANTTKKTAKRKR